MYPYMRVCAYTRFSLYFHCNNKSNNTAITPPSGFGFLTPPGLDCDAKEHNLTIRANLSE